MRESTVIEMVKEWSGILHSQREAMIELLRELNRIGLADNGKLGELVDKSRSMVRKADAEADAFNARWVRVKGGGDE